MRRFTLTYERHYHGSKNLQKRIIEGCQFSDGRVGYVELGSGRCAVLPAVHEIIIDLTYEGHAPIIEWLDPE